MNRIAVVLMMVALAGTVASAETKSWAALENHVPADTEKLIGVDVKALRATASFAKVIALVPDAAKRVDYIKQNCALDVTTVISDITLAIKTTGPDQVIVAVGLDGIDESKLVACGNKLAAAKTAKGKLAVRRSGKVTEYDFDDGIGEAKLYATWPAKDVVVFPANIDDKTKLDPYFTGKAAKGDLAAMLSKLSAPASTVGWIAAGGGPGMTGMYGAVAFAKGTFTAGVHIVAESAKTAPTIASDISAGIQEGVAKLPQDAARVLGGIKVTTAGDTVTLDGSIADADLPALVTAMMAM